jgi:hypothetical protein
MLRAAAGPTHLFSPCGVEILRRQRPLGTHWVQNDKNLYYLFYSVISLVDYWTSLLFR